MGDKEEQSTGGVTAEEEQQGQAAPEESEDQQDQEQQGIEGQPPGQGVTEDSQQKPQDDYFKNKAFEFERKYNRTAEELAEIKEMIKSQQSNTQQQPQYSEEQLRAALSSETLTPDQRAFAQNELKKIEDQKLEERDKRLIDQIRNENQSQMLKQQAEQQVLNDPRFQEAFVKLPNGQVQWKQDSVLAQTIGAYMNDPRLKDQPDAVLIAAKLAYSDMQASQKEKELGKVKRENEKLKGQTMTEGGGKNFNKPAEDPLRESITRLKTGKPGDKKASTSAVREFIRRRNAMK